MFGLFLGKSSHQIDYVFTVLIHEAQGRIYAKKRSTLSLPQPF